MTFARLLATLLFVSCLAHVLVVDCGCQSAPTNEPTIADVATRAWWSPKRRYYTVVGSVESDGPVRLVGDRDELAWRVPAGVGPDEIIIPCDDARRLVRLAPLVPDATAASLERAAVTIYEDGLVLSRYSVGDLISGPAALRPTNLRQTTNAVAPPALMPAPELSGEPPRVDPNGATNPGTANSATATALTWWRGAASAETLISGAGRSLVITTVENRTMEWDLVSGRATRGVPTKPDDPFETARATLTRAATVAPVPVATLGFRPAGVVADLAGGLYVLDGTPAGGKLGRVAAVGADPSVPQPVGETLVSIFDGLAGGPVSATFAPNNLGQPGGGLTVCLAGSRRVVKVLPDGRVTTLAQTFAGSPLLGPVDAVYDSLGHLLFTDAEAANPTLTTGAVYLITREGTLYQAARGLACPAGLALRADGGELYLAESGADRILAFPIERPVGQAPQLGRPRIVAKLPNGTRPWGLVRATNGALLTLGLGNSEAASRVEVFAPDGQTLGRLPLGGEGIGRLTFGTGKWDAQALLVPLADRSGNRIVRIATGLTGQASVFAPPQFVEPIGSVRTVPPR